MVVEDQQFRVFVANTKAGMITADLPPSALSWGQRLNDAGPISADFKIRARELAKLDLRSNTAPLMQSLGVAYGDTVLECGPIWKRAYDPATETLKVAAAGIWSILDKRKALNWVALLTGKPITSFQTRELAARITSSNLRIAGRSLGSIAAELVRGGIHDNPDGGLPIVLPDIIDQAGNERNFNGFELGWVGDRLKQLTQVQGGPDIRFQPRFVDSNQTRIEWVMQTGTPSQPLLVQSGEDWVWDGTVERSGVAGFGVEEDATGLGSTAYTPGAGQEADMLLALSTTRALVDAGYPYTEVDTASKDVEDLGVLQGWSDRALADAMSPWSVYSISARANQSPRLGDYLPGHMGQLITPEDHPIIPGGSHRIRLMAVDGDHTQMVKLAIAPVQDMTGAGYGVGSTTMASDFTPLSPAVDLFPSPNLFMPGG